MIDKAVCDKKCWSVTSFGQAMNSFHHSMLWNLMVKVNQQADE